MLYFGEDYLRVKESYEDSAEQQDIVDYSEDYHKLRWGNIVGSLGWNYVLNPKTVRRVYRGVFTLCFPAYIRRR